jgi:tetratricopeptide (TPR) repeat protein
MVSTEEADKDVCANCGIAGVDNIRLEECDGCDLVKYCSTNCREEHREQHDQDCKKRADKLHDKRLFTQPDSTHRGECPICFLPTPVGPKKSTFMACCGQTICNGCCYAHVMSNKHDTVKRTRCLFCRTPTSDDKEYEKRKKERIEANDPAALSFWGTEYYLKGDFDKALKYFTKAAELGDAEAHAKLGQMYGDGEVAEKDEEKAAYHWEKAAIGGHPDARYYLAYVEAKNGNMDRGVKHFVIAANLGYDKSMKALLPFYKGGFITKEEYGATLRTHQAAVDATKSAQRDAAEKDWRFR